MSNARRLCAFALVATAIGAHPAWAQQGPLSFRFGTSVAWDSNAFKLPDSAPDPEAGVSGKDDRATTLTAGLRFEQPVSQQRFSFDLNANATRYEKFSALDRDTSGYTGAWAWVLTRRLKGNLSFSRDESAVEQEDVQGIRAVVLRTTKSRNATADAWITGGWYVLGGLSHSEIGHSQSFAAQPDSEQNTGELGMRYALPTGSSISLLRRSGSGSQEAAATAGLAVAATDYDTKETELRANWVASARSTLLGRLTRTSRRHDQAPERDFSGNAAELSWAWQPTGRLTITTLALRRIEPFLLGTGSTHRVEDALVFAPSWLIGPRFTLRGSLSRRKSEYSADATGLAGGARSDVLDSAEVGVSWLPTRVFSVTATLRRDDRSSSDPSFDFKGTLVSLNGLLSF